MSSVPISATVAAAKAGGMSKALNLMFVLDTTASMGTSTDDTGCNVPGVAAGKASKLQCAMYGVQLVLKQLNPQLDKVGLMVFPGMSATWTPCGTPAIEPYGTSGIVYQTIHAALDTNYATVQGTLADTSSLVKAVGDGTAVTGCLNAKGGEGTYYAEVLKKAQAALVAQGSSTAQNVIILLSDGAAAASGSQFNSTYATTACSPSTVCIQQQAQMCNQAVYQAGQATAAGTWVYSIAYDSPSTSCPSFVVGSGKSAVTYYDSPTGTNVNVWTPCTAMQKIAGDSSKFFSTSSTCTYGPNNYSDVATAFQQVGATLSAPRLVISGS